MRITAAAILSGAIVATIGIARPDRARAAVDCFDYQNAFLDQNSNDQYDDGEPGKHAVSGSSQSMPGGYSELESTLNVKVSHPDWRNLFGNTAANGNAHPLCGSETEPESEET